jgi:hypothetical protein
MFGNFQQVEDAEKARFACQLRGYIREPDKFDRVNFDFTLFHAIARASSDVRARPDADAAGDFTAANAFAKAPGEGHGKSLAGQSAVGQVYSFRRGSSAQDLHQGRCRILSSSWPHR